MARRIVFLLFLVGAAGCTEPTINPAEPDPSIPSVGHPAMQGALFTLGGAIGNNAYGPLAGTAEVTLNHTSTAVAALLEVRAAPAKIWIWNPAICEQTTAAQGACQLALIEGREQPGARSLDMTEHRHLIGEATLEALACSAPCELRITLATPSTENIGAAFTWSFDKGPDGDLTGYSAFDAPGATSAPGDT